MIRLLVPLLLSLAEPITASYAANLNYRSPSHHHPSLGLSLRTIAARHAAAASSKYLWDPWALNFTHGVASGDPYDTTVILWTRAAPSMDNDRSNVTVEGGVGLYSHETERWVEASQAPVCVEFRVGTSMKFERGTVIDKGRVWTSSDIDYTVKFEAKHMKPFTTYYYQFNICDSENFSPIGRTKTTPSKHDEVNGEVKLAVYSCANLPFGFFNAYGNPARKDSVDYVVFLGDYIYEMENGDDGGWGDSLGRIPKPNREIITLYDYRRRYANYREDLDLLLSHQKFAWMAVWDDHEVADNVWRDGSATLSNTEDSFVKDGGVSVDQRKMNAVRAYFEWMPIRQVSMDDNLRIWRTFHIGTLMDLIFIDTRLYDRSITDLYYNTDYINSISNDAGRTLMGPHQESWFYSQLSHSSDRGATWRVVGNQIVFSRINESISHGPKNPLRYDNWDGYQSNRNRTLHHLYSNQINNTIFLSGDSHASWVSDLVWLDSHPYDQATGAGSIGVEFAGSAITSPCAYGRNITVEHANNYSQWLVDNNQELQWQDLYYRGYFEMSVGYESVNTTFFGTPDIQTRNGFEIALANFTVVRGGNKLVRGEAGEKKGIVAGGVAESGALKGGVVVGENITHDTETGTWFHWPPRETRLDKHVLEIQDVVPELMA